MLSFPEPEYFMVKLNVGKHYAGEFKIHADTMGNVQAGGVLVFKQGKGYIRAEVMGMRPAR